MSDPTKIPGTDEAWESGDLGRDEKYVGVAQTTPEFDAQIDAALDLQMISIRLQKSLIEDFKIIAKLNGLGYQPLMRQILTRFIDSEKKRLIREAASELNKQPESTNEQGQDSDGARRKRAC